MKHYELLYNGHLHTEKLSHAIFVALTTLIIGSWTISIRYLESPTRVSIDIFSMVLAVAGLILVYKLQVSVEEVHLILNRIRERLGHNALECKGIPIFRGWNEYDDRLIKDFGFMPRSGIPSTGGYSWWAVYKWLYVFMYAISICLVVVHLSWGWSWLWTTMILLIDLGGGIFVLFLALYLIVGTPAQKKEKQKRELVDK